MIAYEIYGRELQVKMFEVMYFFENTVTYGW